MTVDNGYIQSLKHASQNYGCIRCRAEYARLSHPYGQGRARRGIPDVMTGHFVSGIAPLKRAKPKVVAHG